MLRQEQVESWSIGKLCPNLAEGLPGGSVHMPANAILPPRHTATRGHRVKACQGGF